MYSNSTSCHDCLSVKTQIHLSSRISGKLFLLPAKINENERTTLNGGLDGNDWTRNMQQDSRTDIFGKCISNNRIQEYETKIVRIDNSKVNEWRLERDNAIKGAHFSTSSKSIISMIFMSLNHT